MLGGSTDTRSSHLAPSQLSESQSSYGKKYADWQNQQNRQKEFSTDGSNHLMQ